MNRILESYEALKEARGFKAGLARVGVAALAGTGVMVLLFGFVGGMGWLITQPETHPIRQVLSVIALPTLVLSTIVAVTLIAHIILFPSS